MNKAVFSMRYLLAGGLLLSCFLVPMVSLADDARVDSEDSRLTRQHSLLFLDGIALSGEVVSHHPDGDILSVTDYRDGKRDGRQLSWYKNGQAKNEASYVAGRREGEARSWWPNGQLQYQRQFKNGLLEGETLEWSESGILKYRQNYTAGREDGLQSGWHDDGAPAFSYVYREGRRFGVIASKPCFSVNPDASEFFNENL